MKIYTNIKGQINSYEASSNNVRVIPNATTICDRFRYESQFTKIYQVALRATAFHFQITTEDVRSAIRRVLQGERN